MDYSEFITSIIKLKKIGLTKITISKECFEWLLLNRPVINDVLITDIYGVKLEVEE